MHPTGLMNAPTAAASASASEARNNDSNDTRGDYCQPGVFPREDGEWDGTYLATPLMMARRIPAMPLTTAVIAFPMARKTDLICAWEKVSGGGLAGWGVICGDVRRRERHPFLLVWFGLFEGEIDR